MLNFFTLKSDTAAVKIARSHGSNSIVFSYISSPVLTFINFKLSFGFKLVGPEINVVSNPFSTKEFAISYPCLPLDLLVINLTGSINSWVGPAVTIAFNFLFLLICLK